MSKVPYRRLEMTIRGREVVQLRDSRGKIITTAYSEEAKRTARAYFERLEPQREVLRQRIEYTRERRTANLTRKRKLRGLGYKYTYTIYGRFASTEKGRIENKRIEVFAKYPPRQRDFARLYETVIGFQGTGDRRTAQYRDTPYGAPLETHQILTHNQLKNPRYAVDVGEWVDYDAES